MGIPNSFSRLAHWLCAGDMLVIAPGFSARSKCKPCAECPSSYSLVMPHCPSRLGPPRWRWRTSLIFTKSTSASTVARNPEVKAGTAWLSWESRPSSTCARQTSIPAKRKSWRWKRPECTMPTCRSATSGRRPISRSRRCWPWWTTPRAPSSYTAAGDRTAPVR